MAEWSGWAQFPFTRRREDLSVIGDGARPGRHVSDCIHNIKKSVGDPTGPIPGEDPWLRAQVGFLWEYALELIANTGASVEEAMSAALRRHMLADRERVVKQLKLEKDGIKGTPDGLDPAKGCLESYKATWRSFRGCDTLEGFEDKFWAWHLQEKAYCAQAGYSKCRWVVLWVCGDYSRPIGPKLLECTVTWDQTEIDQAWQAIMNNADEVDERGME